MNENEKLKEDIKKDPKAEALIKSIAGMNLDVKEDDIRFIFYIGATYEGLRVVEKSQRMIMASFTERCKRAAEGGVL